MIYFSLLFACTQSKTDSADTNNSDDTSLTEDTAEQYPADPSPFTITISGAESETLIFDKPSCSSPTGSPNMRMFWRNRSGSHVFVLLAEVLGDFDGVGTYTAPEQRVNIKLQEEAGGQGRYFASNDSSNSVITYDISDDNFISGEASVNALYNGDLEVTLSPSSFPLWCDDIER